MVSGLKSELDFLKKQVLSANDAGMSKCAAEEPAMDAIESPVDDVIEQANVTPEVKEVVRKNFGLNRPSRREAFIVYYNLNGKSNVKKVQFSYALTGRTNQIGLLQKLKGKKLGRGCLLVPSVNLDQMQEFFGFWDVDIATQKILLLD